MQDGLQSVRDTGIRYSVRSVSHIICMDIFLISCSFWKRSTPRGGIRNPPLHWIWLYCILSDGRLQYILHILPDGIRCDDFGKIFYGILKKGLDKAGEMWYTITRKPKVKDQRSRTKGNRRYSQAVRQKSAKLLFPGSIPGGALQKKDSLRIGGCFFAYIKQTTENPGGIFSVSYFISHPSYLSHTATASSTQLFPRFSFSRLK